MQGYWGQPAKTHEVLVANPFQASRDELVYRTGDLVTLDPDGNYVYIGRLDSMVKIRGYRVELGEVETALYRHPAIKEAAVLPVSDELLGSRLRAVITTVKGDGEVGGGEQLCQHHCPVAHVAAEFPQLCEAETEAFGRLLGTPVQRLATISRGDGICTTHVTAPSLAHSRDTRRQSDITTTIGGLSA
jgi:acyl-CoA synthetase (AMP-forming)/AMP-acid ligase II